MSLDDTDDISSTSDAPVVVKKTRKRVRRVGPHSAPIAFMTLDRRTREARLIAETEAELLKHIGGKATQVQRQLITRISMLTLHCTMFDRRALENGGHLSPHDSNQYLAYSNALERALHRLGVQPGAKPVQTLQDLLAGDGDDFADEPVAVAPPKRRGRPPKNGYPDDLMRVRAP